MGAVVHFAVDLVLVSMVLAGIRRSTGLELNYSKSDLRYYISKYVALGEIMFDRCVNLCEMSGWFVRRGPFGGPSQE